MIPEFPKETPRLGFGCARLDGDRHRRHSLRLLETAFDSGIRYFDTARLYALGRAEGVLGQFLGGVRDQLCVATKAGILPAEDAPGSPWSRTKRAVARRLGVVSPNVWTGPRFGVFDVDSLRSSIGTSLRELRTDYLDVLLLHEADTADLEDGQVLSLLGELRSSGVIRTFGIASTREQTDRLVKGYGDHFPIVQIASDVLEDGLGILTGRAGMFAITHSVLSKALGRITHRLSGDPVFSSRWSAEVKVDTRDLDSIAGLLLAEALDANNSGLVLFSTASPSRIRAAAKIAKGHAFAAAEITYLRQLVATTDWSPSPRSVSPKPRVQ